eukprot:Colp12_sorted_trinity150504_noHs@27307
MQVYVDHSTRDRLDAMLSSLEDNKTISGCGTMLMLGKAVLHSRLPLAETRTVVGYVVARELGPVGVRVTPVHTNGRWYNLVVVQMQAFVLVLLANIRTAYHELANNVRAFEANLVDSNIVLPREEPPVLLRHYATREAILFVYFNQRTGVVVAPQLRPGPAVEQKQAAAAFWWFFAHASSLLSSSGLSDLSMTRDGFRFYARSDGVHQMFVLFSEQVKSEQTEELAARIQHKVLQRFA